MKIKFKRKYILILLLIIFLIFGSQIPAFIYNEYEFLLRANYQLAETAFNDASTMVDIRTGNSDILASDEEKAGLSLPINKAIERIIQSVEKQKEYLNKQQKLLILLPKKYKEYHLIKKSFLMDYSDSFYAYQKIKTTEHWFYNTIVKMDNAHNDIADLDYSKPGYKEKLAEHSKIAEEINQETKEILEQKRLTDGLADYITMNNDLVIYIDTVVNNPEADKDSIISGLESVNYIYSQVPDFEDEFTRWHDWIVDPQINLGKKQYESAIEKLTKADNYYTDYNLNRDWITIILAKFLKTYPKNINQFIPPADSIEESGKIRIDLNGDANQEFLIIDPGDQTQPNDHIKSMIAYDSVGNVIASKPDEITVPQLMFGSAKIYRLKETDRKEAVSFEFPAGPHQSQVMFFALNKDKILPVCLKEKVTGPFDCLFFIGNVGYLPVMDLDQDGLAEVIETTDEYPSEGKLNQEEQAAITEVAGESETNEFTQAMEQIAKREKGGRGRMVVWAIFSYNGKFFKEQSGKDYDRLYNLIGSQIKNKMKKSELSRDSLEYLNLVRKLWNK